jgi:iron(III) transport system permease protein
MCCLRPLGTGSAWLVTAFDFRGRRLFEWALLLPLAVPTYIMAYVWMDLLHPIGPVQSGLRTLLGIASPQDFRLPELRSIGGCVLVLGFVLYPYVYLTTRAMFLMQASGVLDRALSSSASRCHWRARQSPWVRRWR